MPTKTDALAHGREAYARRAWADAYACLSAADRKASLEPEDLERLATAACLSGKDSDDLLVSPPPLEFQVADREVLRQRLTDAGLTEGQRADVRSVLDGMLRERSQGSDAAVLTNPVHIGIGTK